MKYGVFLPTGFVNEFPEGADPVAAHAAVTSLVLAAEESGYDGVWLLDHLVPAPPSQGPLFESWVTAAGLARDTSRIRIGHLVTGNGYRNPALQAKMASTLDVLAGGRYTFGIGAGWYEPDYLAYGYDLPPVGERMARLEEAVRVIQALWTDERATVAGRYYRVTDAVNQPKGVQRPRIPMLIAGGGEKVTLRLVAEYGDACNFLIDPAGAEHKFAVLRRHCEAAGRDYAEITRTVQVMVSIADTDEEARADVGPVPEGLYPGDVLTYGLIGRPETIRERIAAFEEAGVQELILGFAPAHREESLRRFADEFVGSAEPAGVAG
jgi:F420-dependent oxidoreductase-like protein